MARVDDLFSSCSSSCASCSSWWTALSMVLIVAV